MRVCVAGAGYIGLITAAVLADIGHDVICFDVDDARIETLNKGIVPIHEPGLDTTIKRMVKAHKLRFTTNSLEAIQFGEIIYICVNTPPQPDGSLDMSNVYNVARMIAECMNDYKVVIQKSTVPVGTARVIEQIIIDNKPEEFEFDIVANPEFLREGCAIHDSFKGDRIVIGADSWRAIDKVMALYSPFVNQIVLTSVASAEMIKYASNAFLATKISFINAIANMCEHVGADVKEVARGMGADHRIGEKFLEAGLGYGGSCLGKDNKALIWQADKVGYSFDLLKAVEQINDQQPAKFVARLKKELSGLKGKRIGLLGLAFKPDTDDIRDARSIRLIRLLASEGAKIQAYDPRAMNNMAKVFGDVKYCKNPYETAHKADALIVVTEWSEFKELDFERIKLLMHRPILFDGRNMFDPDEIRGRGFIYRGIGRD